MGEPAQRRIIAFDLDGTLTRADTLTDFLIWRTGLLPSVLLGFLLIPQVLAYGLGLLDRSRLKEASLRLFLRGAPIETLAAESQQFAAQRLPKILRPQGLDALRVHVAAGDRVFLVTASPEFVSIGFCRAEGLEQVATRLEAADGRYTGRLEGLNCRGLEKIRRLSEILGPSFRLSAAYGDSDGDKEMLAIASQAHFKPFRGNQGR